MITHRFSIQEDAVHLLLSLTAAAYCLVCIYLWCFPSISSMSHTVLVGSGALLPLAPPEKGAGKEAGFCFSVVTNDMVVTHRQIDR